MDIVSKFITTGRYKDYLHHLQSMGPDRFDIGEWEKKSNMFVCKYKLCSQRHNLDEVISGIGILQAEILGAATSEAVIRLMSVVTHNLFYLKITSSILNSANILLVVKEMEHSLRPTLECVSEYYGLRVLEHTVESFCSLLQQQGKLCEGNTLLLYDCAVLLVLKYQYKKAVEVLNYLKDHACDKSQNLTKHQKDPTTVLLCIDGTPMDMSLAAVLSRQINQHLLVSHFLDKEYKVCLSYMENLDDNSELKDLACEDFIYMKAWIHYFSEDYEKCITVSQNCLQSPDVSNSLCAKFINLVGCCLAKQGKPQSAIQRFREALAKDFDFLLPLYNVSLQYRQTGVQDPELECLNLLYNATQQLEERSNPREQDHWHNVSLSTALLQRHCHMSEQISASQALYALAHRCLQLDRFDVGSQKYMDLIKLIKSSEDNKPMNSSEMVISIPELSQLYIECAYCLLCCGQYQQCIEVCDELLQAADMLPHSGQTLSSHTQGLSGHHQRFMQDTRTSDEDEDLLAMLTGDDDMTSDVKHLQSSQTHTSQKKRESNADSNRTTETDLGSIWLYKADALTQTGSYSEALQCLDRFIYSLEDEVEMKDFKNSSKKPKQEYTPVKSDGDSVTPETCRVSPDHMERLQTAHLNKAVVLLALGDFHGAVQASRITGCKSDTAIYIHTFSLLKLGRHREACSVWLPHRKLDTRVDPLQLQHLIKTKSSLIETEQGDRTPENTTSVTSQDCLKMDLCCLKHLLKSQETRYYSAI